MPSATLTWWPCRVPSPRRCPRSVEHQEAQPGMDIAGNTPARRSSVRSHLFNFAKSKNLSPTLREVDLCHGDDLTEDDLFTELLSSAREGSFKAVLASPQCSTWFLAGHGNRRGPPPLMSKEWPLGFPWLSGHLARATETANVLLDRSIEIPRGFGF